MTGTAENKIHTVREGWGQGMSSGRGWALGSGRVEGWRSQGATELSQGAGGCEQEREGGEQQASWKWDFGEAFPSEYGK